MKILAFFEVKKTGQHYSMHLKSMTDFYRIKQDKGLRIKDMASMIEQSTGETLERRKYESDREIAIVRIGRTEEEIARSASIDEMEDIHEYMSKYQTYSAQGIASDGTMDNLSSKLAAAGRTAADFQKETEKITKRLFERKSEEEQAEIKSEFEQQQEQESKEDPRTLLKSDVDNILKEIKRRELRIIRREAHVEEKLDKMQQEYMELKKNVEAFIGEVLFHREIMAEDTKMYMQEEERKGRKIYDIESVIQNIDNRLSDLTTAMRYPPNTHYGIEKGANPAEAFKTSNKDNWFKRLFK